METKFLFSAGNRKETKMEKNCDTCKFRDLEKRTHPCGFCELNTYLKPKSGHINWQPIKPRRKELQATIAEQAAKIELDRIAHNAEVDQYNAGYEAGEKGEVGEYDAPHYEPDYDSWRSGYRDASYDRLMRELAAKDAEIAEHRRHVSEVMKREDALKKQLAAPP